MNISETDKAYIAGLIDGEGSICILKANSKKVGTHNYGAVVQIRMTNKEPVYFVAERYGGIVKHHNRTSKGKIIYDLKIYSHNAVSLLKDINQYLQCKGRQAGVVFALYKVEPAYGKTADEKELIELERIRLMSLCQRLNKTSHGINIGGRYD
jgi:hypothetical protein